MQGKAISPEPAGTMRVWRRFIAAGVGGAWLVVAAFAGLIIWADPYGLGLRAKAGGDEPTPGKLALMDVNQRFMLPQVIRSQRYDSAVIGTSSVKLLDPARLTALTGGRFANLGMNAATPWEQTQISSLARRSWPSPALLVWGLDTTWCEADATSPAKQLTPRPFPPWLYARQSWRDLPKILNMTTLEIALRGLAHHFGWMRERMRADGFDEFTPPDATYDPARAREHLYRGTVFRPLPDAGPEALRPEASLSLQEALTLTSFPALGWLQEELAQYPHSTRKILLLPPLHGASLPSVDPGAGRRDAACKAALVSLARATGAGVMDYRRPSPLTANDSKFWDPLHYRVGVAREVESDLAAVFAGAQPRGGDGALYVPPSR